MKAMKNGHFLYIDEINMAKPETLPLLHGALDYRKMITNPFTQEVVYGDDEYRVIAAINEGYVEQWTKRSVKTVSLLLKFLTFKVIH